MKEIVHSYGKVKIRYCSEQKTYGIYIGGRAFIFGEKSFKNNSRLSNSALKKNLIRNYSGIISTMRKEEVSLSDLEKAFYDLKTGNLK